MAGAFVPHYLPPPPNDRAHTRARCAPSMHAAPGLSAGDVSRADWRSFRARLVHSEQADLPSIAGEEWAHPLAHVEVGCVLVSDPGHSWPASFAHLNRAVVLVTSVSARAVSGLLLTRPTRFRVGDRESAVGRAGFEFGDNILHLGGDASLGSLEVLHGHDVPGARALVPGLSVGGLNGARAAVRRGEATTKDFHFFVAYARWGRDQLTEELAGGAWAVAACAPGVILGAGLEEDGREPEALWRRLRELLGVRGSV